jgi:hypothetical protein
MHYGGGGLEPRTAIELSFSAWGGLGKPNRGRGRGETFFPDSGSDRDIDETFPISRNRGLVHVEFICLLDSQPWVRGRGEPIRTTGEKALPITYICSNQAPKFMHN